MELQKIKNLLDHKTKDYPKYQAKKWYIINDRNNGNYPEGDGNDRSIKIDTEVVKPFLCDYADAYILVTGNITVENVAAANVPNFKGVKGFNGVFSRNNLPSLKNGAYVINLDHSENTGAHWVVVLIRKDEFFEFPEVIYFDSFGVEYIPKEVMKKIRNKNIKTSIFRIQDNNSIMRGYFCILFIEYMLNNKTD